MRGTGSALQVDLYWRSARSAYLGSVELRNSDPQPTRISYPEAPLRTDQYRWLLERVEALHRILAPRVKALPVPE